MKTKIIGIIAVVMVCFLTACVNTNEVNTGEGGGENMHEDTFQAAAELNDKSELGECVLLEAISGNSRIAIPYRINDSKDSYYYFPYGDNNYITQIAIESDAFDVFGIAVGMKVTDAEAILKEEGYEKLPDSDEEPFLTLNKQGVIYRKYDISITLSTSDDIINEILIDVVDLNVELPTF